VFAGRDAAEGRFLRSSAQQAFANLRTGRPGPLPRPVANIADVLPPEILRSVNHALGCAAVGDAAQVRQALGALIDEYAPDEVILAGAIHDPEARKRSYSIAAEAMQALELAAAV
jgi:alkanesulfonate monooxygenase SsuD/methylene tetrahydromethanopterin reductase-like flavin-dependent oxidoreductase (luciferase family)